MKRMKIFLILTIMSVFAACASNGSQAAATSTPGTGTGTTLTSCVVGTNIVGSCKVN